MPNDPDADRKLTELVDQARSADAARERSQRRWLRQQAEEAATLAGVFVDALANGARLTVRTTSGARHSGAVTAVGRDYVTLDTGTAAVAVRFGAVTAVLADPALSTGTAASSLAGRDLLFVEMLSEAVADSPQVWLVAAGDPEPVRGRLRAVGADVVSVGVGASVVYVSLAAVSEVSLDVSP